MRGVIVAKGWNFDYLTKMSEEYKDLSEREENQEKKELYEDIYDLYQSLMLKLLFQEGEVYYSDVTTFKVKNPTYSLDGWIKEGENWYFYKDGKKSIFLFRELVVPL